MKAELTKTNRSHGTNYMSSTCGLHAHNLTMKNPISSLFGEGGLQERNALQLIHSAYNLQSGGGGGMELQEFTAIYAELYGGEKFKCISCPVMTRWYTIGLGAKRVMEEWEKLKVISKKNATRINIGIGTE